MSDTLINEIGKSTYWDITLDKMLSKKNIQYEDKKFYYMANDLNLKEIIIQKILNGNYKWSIPKKIELVKPGTNKKRIVYVHSPLDRFILGILYRACSAFYKDKISHHVYSYKEGERTLSAVHSILKDKTLYKKHAVKLDISAYFNSVNRDTLKSIIDDLFIKEPCLHKLFTDLLLRDKVRYKDKVIDEYMSLIPGSAFSSFLANYCLKDLDEYLGTQQGYTYARYSDDMIFFADNKEKLYDIIEVVKSFLSKYGLDINPSKYEFYEPGQPITFLGLKFNQYIDEDGNIKDTIDIGKVSFNKLKKIIRTECKQAHKKVTLNHSSVDKELAKVISKINKYVYQSYIVDAQTYGWAYYIFGNINCIDTLRELDFYLINTLQYVATGKHNKANIKKCPRERLVNLGLQSFVEMYNIYNIDFDVYRQKVMTLKPVYIDSDIDTLDTSSWQS